MPLAHISERGGLARPQRQRLRRPATDALAALALATFALALAAASLAALHAPLSSIPAATTHTTDTAIAEIGLHTIMPV